MKTIEVNQYIEKFSEIKPQLDQTLEGLNVTELTVINDGCSNKLVDKIVKYVKDHNVVCIVESKGNGAANRLNKLFGC